VARYDFNCDDSLPIMKDKWVWLEGTRPIFKKSSTFKGLK